MTRLTGLIYFSADDSGCYADGSYGHEHVRAKLAGLVKDIVMRRGGDLFGRDIWNALTHPMSDDASEEMDAIDYLQEHTSDDALWCFEGGDLLLMATGSDEEIPGCTNHADVRQESCPSCMDKEEK